MSFISRFFKSRRSEGSHDPISEQLKQEERDPTKWDKRWQLLYEKLARFFEPRFPNAEDLAMTVIITLIMKGHDIGDPNTFYSALNMARKVGANEARRMKRDMQHEEFDEFNSPKVSEPEQHASLEEEEYQRLTKHCLNEALNKLKPEDKRLLLSYRHCIDSGMSVDECSAMLGVKKQTLKNRASLLLMQVSNHAHRCLEKYGY